MKRYVIREGYSGTVFEQSDDLDDFLEDCWETQNFYIEVVDIQFENDIKDKYDYYSSVRRMLKDFYGENAKITDKNIWDGKEAEVTESRYVVKNGLSGTIYYETDDLALGKLETKYKEEQRKETKRKSKGMSL